MDNGHKILVVRHPPNLPETNSTVGSGPSPPKSREMSSVGERAQLTPDQDQTRQLWTTSTPGQVAQRPVFD
ncbi:uncharacterized protein P884DRAFT_258581 [Thermothelomyces heterothallicus CBS 202.75]|uniref:uncharacterized protein n=1 Tax=Thermothelomyces heterothallicus CBS 202.75 TaxID=1149848 RepID=UPI003744138E